MRKTVTIVYNTCVYVVKFRLRLIEALQEEGYDVVVIAPEDEATPVLRERGVRHLHIEMSQYGMNPFAEMRGMRALRRMLEDIRPIASLHYTIKPNTFGTMAAHRAGVPVLNNIAGAGRAFSGGNPVMRVIVVSLYRKALGCAHTVFFQNDDDMEVFVRERLVRAKQCVRVPGSGVDLERFRPVPLPEQATRFLFVGRLLLEKGIVEFLQAARAVLSRDQFSNSVEFHIAGEHNSTRHYISGADLDRLSGDSRITYHGTVSPHEVDQLMRDSSCVVLPSYYGEGVPRVLLEACASGRPIITTDNVGCRDVVEPGVNGWKVATRSAEALAEAFEAFLAMPLDARAQMGEAARLTAETRFDERKVIGAYIERIRKIDTASEEQIR